VWLSSGFYTKTRRGRSVSAGDRSCERSARTPVRSSTPHQARINSCMPSVGGAPHSRHYCRGHNEDHRIFVGAAVSPTPLLDKPSAVCRDRICTQSPGTCRAGRLRQHENRKHARKIRFDCCCGHRLCHHRLRWVGEQSFRPWRCIGGRGPRRHGWRGLRCGGGCRWCSEHGHGRRGGKWRRLWWSRLQQWRRRRHDWHGRAGHRR
jgi:hypothetical protein